MILRIILKRNNQLEKVLMKIYLTLLIYSISVSLNNLFCRTQYENVTYI